MSEAHFQFPFMLPDARTFPNLKALRIPPSFRIIRRPLPVGQGRQACGDSWPLLFPPLQGPLTLQFVVRHSCVSELKGIVFEHWFQDPELNQIMQNFHSLKGFRLFLKAGSLPGKFYLFSI